MSGGLDSIFAAENALANLGIKIGTPVAKVTPEPKFKPGDENHTEIERTCAVLGCEDGRNMDFESFYSFPKEHSIRQIWTDMTGRTNWTPNDYSYICASHFTPDSFVLGTKKNYLVVSAVPTLKLPPHVMEVEYVDENALAEYDSLDDTDELQNSDFFYESTSNESDSEIKPKHTEELLKLFTEVQTKQRQVVTLKDRLKYDKKLSNRQNRAIAKLKDLISRKEKLLQQKQRETKSSQPLEEKIKKDNNSLIMAMPVKYTDDVKNFALSIYKYSPQGYIYLRNTLRTMLPGTEMLESWVASGYEAKNVMNSASSVKIISEVSDNEMQCKVFIH